MNRLKIKYQQKIRPELQKELKLDNLMAVPTVTKIIVSMGISDFPQDNRNRMKVIENVIEQFKVITGQTAQVTKAKKAIANFKTRAGDPLGVMVTLRGEKMWQFLDKLISMALPRFKDFQGVKRGSFDGHGNYNLGIEEQIAFPEIVYDQIESIRGLQVTIVTSTDDNKQAELLLEKLGMPFEKVN